MFVQCQQEREVGRHSTTWRWIERVWKQNWSYRGTSALTDLCLALALLVYTVDICYNRLSLASSHKNLGDGFLTISNFSHCFGLQRELGYLRPKATYCLLLLLMGKNMAAAAAMSGLVI